MALTACAVTTIVESQRPDRGYKYLVLNIPPFYNVQTPNFFFFW